MFMILLGIFWFGQAFTIYGAITRAAQEGARAGAVPYCATCPGINTHGQYATNSANAVMSALTASKLDWNQAQYPVPEPTVTSCIPAPVTCSTGGDPHFCVQLPIQMNVKPGGAGACGVSVSFRYPFRFWLPFTSINNQQIWMTASARVRLEGR